jgi:hypothetical protein
MSIVLQGSTSGSCTLQEQAIAGTTVLTLPTTSGTVLTSTSPSSDLPSSINGPSFSAYNNASQTITAATETVAVLNTEEWDTGNCFNNTGSTVTLNGLSVPAYAFCPNVAGYYQVSANLRFARSGGTFTACIGNFFKNGSVIYRWFELASGTYSTGWNSSGSMLIYLNGTGDYVTLVGSVTGGTGTASFDSAGTPYTSRLQAALVRGA